jgi:hypothetical protein
LILAASKSGGALASSRLIPIAPASISAQTNCAGLGRVGRIAALAVGRDGPLHDAHDLA